MVVMGMRSQGYLRSCVPGHAAVLCSSTSPLIRCPLGHLTGSLQKVPSSAESRALMEADPIFYAHLVAAHDLSVSPENMRKKLEHVAELFSLEFKG